MLPYLTPSPTARRRHSPPGGRKDLPISHYQHHLRHSPSPPRKSSSTVHAAGEEEEGSKTKKHKKLEQRTRGKEKRTDGCGSVNDDDGEHLPSSSSFSGSRTNSPSPPPPPTRPEEQYYPDSPREYHSPTALRLSSLEAQQRARVKRLAHVMYGNVRPVVDSSSSSSFPCENNNSSKHNGGGGETMSGRRNHNNKNNYHEGEGVREQQQQLPSKNNSSSSSSPKNTSSCGGATTNIPDRIASATEVKVSPLYNSSNSSVRRVLATIKTAASTKRQRRKAAMQQRQDTNTVPNTNVPTACGGGPARGASQSPTRKGITTTDNRLPVTPGPSPTRTSSINTKKEVRYPHPPHHHPPSGEIVGFGRVNGVYVPHPHAHILPWWVPKVAIPDTVRCAQSALAGQLDAHEAIYINQRSGGDRSNLSTVSSSSISPRPPGGVVADKIVLPSSARERRVLQYNVHAQPSYPNQLLFVGSAPTQVDTCGRDSPNSQPLVNDESTTTTVSTHIPTADIFSSSQPSDNSHELHHTPMSLSPHDEGDHRVTNRGGSSTVIDCRLRRHVDDVTRAIMMIK